MAWRSVEREIPSCSASSRSEGRRSPGPRMPRRMAVPRRSTVSSNVVGGWTGSKTAATAASPGMAEPYTCAATYDGRVVSWPAWSARRAPRLSAMATTPTSSTASASRSSPSARRSASTSARRRRSGCTSARATCSPAASPPPTSCASRGRSTSSTATGPRVWDVDGNEMYDFHNGFGSMVQGHAHPAIGKAIGERYVRGTHFAAPTEDADRRRRGARAPLGHPSLALHELRLGVDDGRDPHRARVHQARHRDEDLRLLPRPPRHGDGLDRGRVRQDRPARGARLAALRRRHPAVGRRRGLLGALQRRRVAGAPDRRPRPRGPQAGLHDHGAGDDEPRGRAPRARLPRGRARDHAQARRRAHLRRGQDRPVHRRGRRRRALRRHARHGHAGQGAGRRHARRRDRRQRGGHVGRRGRLGLPGRHLQRQPARAWRPRART